MALNGYFADAERKGIYTEIARFLIEKGADVNLADTRGTTPIHSASRQGYETIVGLLIEKGVDIKKIG